MDEEKYTAIIESQRAGNSRSPVSCEERRAMLLKLKSCLLSREGELLSALSKDLGKSAEEGYMTELGQVYAEINHMVKHLKGYSEPEKVRTPMTNFPARSYIKKCPYGCVLVISPWNYPVLLSLSPLVDAISAGNSVVLKPSELAPASADALSEVISAAFATEKAAVIKGGADVCSFLLGQNFDYVFYTGGTRVGKIVYGRAAERLIPVTLELGGKSPCFVDETAKFPVTARRIVFGKFLNAGQTCVAPDYIYCHRSVKDKLIAEIGREIIAQYGEEPVKNPAYPRIVNARHFERLKNLLAQSRVIFGGECNAAALKISPAIVEADFGDAVMSEEIFGPVLPVITYDDISEVIENVNSRPAPLAMYIFSENRKVWSLLEERCNFGGGCINDTVMHLTNENLPFGGLGESGIGAYHGRRGFNTFTHEKSMMNKSTAFDPDMRYQPIDGKKIGVIKRFLK